MCVRCISCVRTTLVKKCTFAQSDLVRKHAINFSCCETKISRARQSPMYETMKFYLNCKFLRGKFSPILSSINGKRNFNSHVILLSIPYFSFLSSNFLNESPFFMKNQPCDTIINPKFWVQFPDFLAFKSNIFTIYVSSNCRKTQFF